ncbi:MAG: hypothetical protein GY694_00735, partial [Gammaproteobacteria bacterium]|nr:hypothetical protein [Gammaproteobacteria bacterium]
GAALAWFKSYLFERFQSVTLSNDMSQQSPLSFGVPQGSVLGPVLFVLYTKPLTFLTASHSVSSQSFADDTQLQNSCPSSELHANIQTVQSCILDVKTWMVQNKLKLNDEKTEVLLLKSKATCLPSPEPICMQVGCHSVNFTSSARNLGFTITSDMSLDKHVSNICRSAYFEIRKISSIRHLLTMEASKTLVCAFVLSRLDYCNSLLFSCPKYLLNKLQKVQNAAARLVLKARKRQHASPLLKSLHWLPVNLRVQYKILVLCHTYFSGCLPVYLSHLLSVYTPARQLRSSSDTRLLLVPRTRTKTFGNRSFSHSAPSLWNSLPYQLRHIESTETFKKTLKTHLFTTF